MKPVNPPVFIHLGIITVTVIATNDEEATGKRKGFQGARERSSLALRCVYTCPYCPADREIG
jgi:hypothetical protein